jgi:PhzF family phenazine biosynthesis protein
MHLFWIDAFTDQLFSGNPAGVVPLERWPESDALLQRIAFENGLAETAFFVRTSTDRFHIRWLTPAAEVDLCGHATLASAFVIFNHLGQTGARITLDSRSGPLVVSRLADGRLELDFPATPVAPLDDDALRARIAAMIGQPVAALGRSKFDLVALLANADAVRAARPDFPAVAALDCRGLVITAPGEAGVDFVSRFFAPRLAVPEDPVTGSAHCALTPFWAERLGRTSLTAHQLSPRGGQLACTLAGDRVKLAGRAVLYLRGEIAV